MYVQVHKGTNGMCLQVHKGIMECVYKFTNNGVCVQVHKV